jgi:predicted nuclease of predicted toxin-antitoxin system
VRLLLDEHYSDSIAAALRARGHDVVAIQERDDLRGLSDGRVLLAACAERRVVVTEDLSDFRRRVRRAINEGTPTFGVVCVSPRAFRRDAKSTGRLVRALDALLRALPEDRDVLSRGGEVWLQPAD